MTVIVACSWDGEAAIAGDSMGSDGWTGANHGKKVRRYPFGAIGFSGSYRLVPVIHESLRRTERLETERDSWRFIEEIEKALEDKGWQRETKGCLPTLEEMYLLAVSNRGRLWSVQSDLAVLPCRHVVATGSGYHVALGAARVAKRLGASPAEAARMAAEAACDTVVSCGKPVHVITVTS